MMFFSTKVTTIFLYSLLYCAEGEKKLRGANFSTNHDTEEVRFSSKIKFKEAVYEKNKQLIQNVFPLGPNDYPITNKTVHDLLKVSKCASVILPNDYEVVRNMEEMVDLVGGLPTHAPNSDFWPEFEQVVDMQLLRRERGNDLASQAIPWFPIPQLWNSFTTNEVAEAVRADFPGSIHADFIIQCLRNGLVIDNNIIPRRSTEQFLHQAVMLADINTWAISITGPTNFAAKYYAGRARPEEIAWQIANGEQISNHVPANLKAKINDMNLTKMEEFTAYEEGAPVHPSWPAMHSAASALSMWLPVVTRLKTTQKEEAKIVDLAISMGRTVAGVHYVGDNISGLQMGQEIIARELPRYLAERYGADPMKVKNCVDRLKFDWKEEARRMIPELF